MEMIQLMNIARQHDMNKELYENAAVKSLRSGMYIGGDEVKYFENEFASYHNMKYGVSVANGTDALVIALKSLGIGQGDEVITTAFTFFATAESIAAVGAKPIFVDVDPKTYCIDPKLIEEKITKFTKAIIPVHIYGHSADMIAINKIAKKYQLFVIEDCAQSTGTLYQDELSGQLGDISCFSFFPTKNLGCAGDGGMILTNNDAIASACKAYKSHGSGEDGYKTYIELLKSKNCSLNPNLVFGKTKYYNYVVGFNSRLDAIQAAILRIKLPFLKEFVQSRRKNAEFYYEKLKETEYVLPFESDDCKHSYYIFAVKHNDATKIKAYLKDHSIQTETYYPIPCHLQGAFDYLGYKKGDLPITEELSNTTFALPVYPELYVEELEYVVKTLKAALKNV